MTQVNEISESEKNGGNDDEKASPAPSLTTTIGNSIKEGDDTYNSLFPSALIYRVPGDLRELKKSAYIPSLISIGPFHRNDLPKDMQHVKKHFADYLFYRCAGEGEENLSRTDEIKYRALQDCVEKLEDRLDEARKYYAEKVEVTDPEMVEMMVVDGCFILELLYSDHIDKIEAEKKTQNGVESSNSKASCSSSTGGAKRQEAHPIFDIVLTANIVKQDLLLLENQIPFFVLEELFKLTVGQIPVENKLSLNDYIILYFHNIFMPPESKNCGSEKKTGGCLGGGCVPWQLCSTEGTARKKANDNRIYHILHLLHNHYRPEREDGSVDQVEVLVDPGENKKLSGEKIPVDQGKNKKLSGEKIPVDQGKNKKLRGEKTFRASDLEYAGVKFAPSKEDNLFKVRFEEVKDISWWCQRADFEIPPLNIHDRTETFLRNLIALEQCCPMVSRHFTSYAKLMDMLIDSEEDVKVLRKAEVINNYLGKDNDVADLFNNLCKGVVQGVQREFFFNEVCQKATSYSERCWPKCIAYFIRTYFASPWSFLGFFLAFVAFGIQIASLVVSILK